MDEYLIKDRSKTKVEDKFFQRETAYFSWHLLVHGLLTLVTASLSLPLLWNAELSAYSTLWPASLLAGSLVIWLWLCCRQHDLHSQIEKKSDSVIEIFAQRLRKIIRIQETVARLGGDEFVALVEGLGPCENRARRQAAQVAEKIIT